MFFEGRSEAPGKACVDHGQEDAGALIQPGGESQAGRRRKDGNAKHRFDEE